MGDVVIAGVGLMLLWPLLCLVAAAIRLTMGPPVLFREERSGLHGEPFTMVKFRTMTDERDQDGRLLPDPLRLTRIGAFFRRTSIDELPQLWSVLKGDMSIIGPRPLPTEYMALYRPDQARRHDVPPGLVGWASVNGRNANTWEKKFELDLWYVDHWSLVLDLKIFLMAIVTVFSGRGVSEEGYATARKFTGSAGKVSGHGIDTCE
jgi:sugar transferase EpsL